LQVVIDPLPLRIDRPAGGRGRHGAARPCSMTCRPRKANSPARSPGSPDSSPASSGAVGCWPANLWTVATDGYQGARGVSIWARLGRLLW